MESDGSLLFPSDGRKSCFCMDCADFTASDVKCLQTKIKRKLKFVCNECENGLKQVPVLIREVADLKDMVDKLINKGNFNDVSHGTKVSPDMEDVVSEVVDRQSRAKSLIIFNVNELRGRNGNEKNLDDGRAVKDILRDHNIDKSELRISRLAEAHVHEIPVIGDYFINSINLMHVDRSLHVSPGRFFRNMSEKKPSQNQDKIDAKLVGY
ncbi:hypothetical protein WA026_018759 [Henosepilachna vigintioctopunctata]|uniref:Uncharacterized protein n=1 Tax=Henosepilachna vigintioctopunctata TaxID=420089 RepID=A0AAW1TY37_9CUCU